MKKKGGSVGVHFLMPQLKNAGKVVFRPSGKGTEIIVTISISYHAPLGIAGENAPKLFNPYFEKLVKDDIMILRLIWNLVKLGFRYFFLLKKGRPVIRYRLFEFISPL